MIFFISKYLVKCLLLYLINKHKSLTWNLIHDAWFFHAMFYGYKHVISST